MEKLPIETMKEGRYRIDQVLGSGGMAVVFRAFDTRMGVHRAIKLLNPRFARNPTIRERFENEAYAQAGLRHPNILMVHDVVEDEVGVYLVMELAEGGSLSERVRRTGPLSPREVALVGVALAGALAVAHAEGVIHRDIKPENVLVDRLGNIKLADFGIARVTARQGDLTRTGSVMGTWAYMPPEQRVGAHDVDARADIYALGASLYFLASGRQPFDMHNVEAHARAFHDFPPALAAVIQRATRFNPSDRYDDCDQMRQELQALAEHLDATPFVGHEPGDDAGGTLAPAVDDLSTYFMSPAEDGDADSGVPPLEPATRPAALRPTPSPPPARGATMVPGDDSLDEAPPRPSPPLPAGPPPAATAPQGAGDTFLSELGPTPAEATLPARRRGPLPLLLGGALVLGLLSLGGWALLREPAAEPAPPRARPDAASARVEPPPEVPPTAAVEPTGSDAPPSPDGGAGPDTPSAATMPSSPAGSEPQAPPAEAPTGSGAEAAGASAGPRVITVIAPAPGEGEEEAPTAEASPAQDGPTGTVVVQTVPSGATVREGGVALSRSGEGYVLPVGRHLLDVEAPGGERTRIPVEVQTGATLRICYSFDTNSACAP